MVAMLVLPLLHVPPVVGSVRVMVEPAHTDVGPEITEDDASVIVTADAKFQKSPSFLPLKFTAFNAPYIITVPVPAVGAVHVAVCTYVVPAPPLPVVATRALGLPPL